MTSADRVSVFEAVARTAVRAVLADSATNRPSWTQGADSAEVASLLNGSVVLLKPASMTIGGLPLTAVAIPRGAVAADGSVNGIPASGRANGWSKGCLGRSWR
jgi:acyl-CoA reductase-like NAD-dependent aldehyde dehydrogenase